jgi:hypothetical protein
MDAILSDHVYTGYMQLTIGWLLNLCSANCIIHQKIEEKKC